MPKSSKLVSGIGRVSDSPNTKEEWFEPIVVTVNRILTSALASDATHVLIEYRQSGNRISVFQMRGDREIGRNSDIVHPRLAQSFVSRLRIMASIAPSRPKGVLYGSVDLFIRVSEGPVANYQIQVVLVPTAEGEIYVLDYSPR